MRAVAKLHRARAGPLRPELTSFANFPVFTRSWRNHCSLNGLLTTLSNRVRAEIFDDFLDHAQLYLKDSRKQEAGVIAGVVFEDTIRRICRDKGIDDKDQKLEYLINALTKQGVITGLQSKQAKVGSHVRTKATHARWDEFDLQSVTQTIQITKRFSSGAPRRLRAVSERKPACVRKAASKCSGRAGSVCHHCAPVAARTASAGAC
jgi:hypothetical protein